MAVCLILFMIISLVLSGTRLTRWQCLDRWNCNDAWKYVTCICIYIYTPSESTLKTDWFIYMIYHDHIQYIHISVPFVAVYSFHMFIVMVLTWRTSCPSALRPLINQLQMACSWAKSWHVTWIGWALNIVQWGGEHGDWQNGSKWSLVPVWDWKH